MALDEGLSNFIGRLYEAVYDDRAWQSAMAELMRRTGSRVAFVSSVDLEEREYSKAFFYAPETSRVDVGKREYWEETAAGDPSLLWATDHPDAGMCETESIIPGQEYLDVPYIKWQRDRFGTTHWRVMYTKPRETGEAA